MKKIFILLGSGITTLSATSFVVSCGDTESNENNQTKPVGSDPIIGNNKKSELVEKINLLAQINPEQYTKYKDDIKKNLTDQEIETLTGEINKIISSYETSFNSLQAQVKETQTWVNGLNLQKILFEAIKPEINKFTNYLTSISVKKINTISNEQIALFNKAILEKKTALIQAEEKIQNQITQLQTELTNEIANAKQQLQTLKQYSTAEFEPLQAELNGFEQTQNSVENLASLNELLNNIKSLIVKIEQKNSTFKTQQEELISSYNQLNTKVLELINQVKAWNATYASDKENEVGTLSNSIASESTTNIQKAISQLNQLQEELTQNITQHNSITQQITNLVEATKNGLLAQLDTSELNNLHTELSEYLKGITNLNIPNEELSKTLLELQQNIAKITAEKDAILTHDKEQKEEVAKLKQEIDLKIKNINSLLSQIRTYDKNYAAKNGKELNDLIANKTNTSTELNKQLAKLEYNLNSHMHERNNILNILKTTSMNNIKGYIKKFSLAKLYNTGTNSLLSEAENIQKLLEQDLNNKSLSELQVIQENYLKKVQKLEQDYQNLFAKATEIQNLALKLRGILEQKEKKHEILTEKETEIKSYIEKLPLGNIELLSSEDVDSTIQTLQQYQKELITK
ncbi:hypothetical protein [Mycoplasma sp. Z473B]|uniref:hypothetical protein n=1 Tax=Mycoplasma sp. Z473B TaxID=3401667 RepID=UPI003AABD6AC